MTAKIQWLMNRYRNETLVNQAKVLWLIIFIPGLVGVLIKFISGERLTGYGSYIPWGLWIAVYFHAVGISGGAFAVGVIGYLRGIQGLKENLNTTLVLSASSLLTGLLAIWLDLGSPFSVYRIAIAPNFASMLSFNAWMYGIFLALVSLVLCLNVKKKDKTQRNDATGWLVPLLVLGFILSIAYPSQSGAFFGVVDAKPFWSSAILPVLFLTSAVTSGAAALLVVHYYLRGETAASTKPTESPFPYLRKIILVCIAFYFIGEFSEYSLALWSPISHIKENVLLVMFGRFWWVFWFVHVGGAAVSFYLLYRSQSLKRMAVGSLVVVISFISTRLNVVIPGQSIPELKGLNEAFTHPRLSFIYTPTIIEYLVALFVVAFGLALFFFGGRLLATYIERHEGKNR